MTRKAIEKALIALLIFDFVPVLFVILISINIIDVSYLGWGFLGIAFFTAWVWCLYHLIITIVVSVKAKKILVFGLLTLIQLVALIPVLISFSDGFPYAWVPVMFISYIMTYVIVILGLQFVRI